MPQRPVTIFLSAAEASGDQRGAQLIHALRQRLPDARFVGAAGPRMAEAGCQVLADLTRQASMLARAVFRAGYFLREVRRLQKAIREIRPDIVVPVDSPALNWHLAAAAKKCGCPVVYYIAPQVWAWGPWRSAKLARLTDHVACILPFEEAYFRSRGIAATYVGHPLFDMLAERPAVLPDLMDAWVTGCWRVAMLPGSRVGEIRDHTPALLRVARAIRSRWPKARCTFITHTEADAQAIRQSCRAGRDNIEVAVQQTEQVLSQSHFAVAKSGTITLELAHFGVPMVVFYRVNWPIHLAYKLLGHWAVPTQAFSLVNILARRRVVPELIPWRGGPASLVRMVLEVLEDLGYLMEARQALLDLTEPLRVKPPGTAAGNAADLICRVLRDKR